MSSAKNSLLIVLSSTNLYSHESNTVVLWIAWIGNQCLITCLIYAVFKKLCDRKDYGDTRACQDVHRCHYVSGNDRSRGQHS
jgi:hypothetical protein